MDIPLPPDDTVIDAGLKDTLGPEGETIPVRLRVPEKPLRLVKVIVVIPVEPWVTLTEVGFALTLKS